jgi:hypothetical protein
MALNRATHAGFCTFDERNNGGRYQTQAELKRFKHVLHATRPIVDVGEKNGGSDAIEAGQLTWVHRLERQRKKVMTINWPFYVQ